MAPVQPPLAKTLLDKALSLTLLVFTAPISAAISASIAVEGLLSPETRGPLLHTEVRVSAGRPFRIYKFRILRPQGEEAILAGAKPKDVENQMGNLTRVGWALKKVGFDEIPQLVNILRGQMSFVGPRPKPVREYEEELRLGHEYRRQLRAGLTGPVQSRKGTGISARDADAVDVEYAQLLLGGSWRKVLMADVRILARTVKVVFKATGE